MELEEQGLRRKCEELRRTLTEKSKKLDQAQELYNKLKQKVLLSQPANDPTGVRGSRLGSDVSRYDLQGQNADGIGSRTNYFPDDSRSSRRNSGSETMGGWTKPVEPQCEFSLLLCYIGVSLTVLQLPYPEHQLVICLWVSHALVSHPWEIRWVTLCRQSLALVVTPSPAGQTTIQRVATSGEQCRHQSRTLNQEAVGDTMIPSFPGHLQSEE